MKNNRGFCYLCGSITPEGREADITIYDMNGAPIWHYGILKLTCGINAVTWNAGERVPGMYFFKVRIGDEIRVGRIMKIR